MEDLRLKERYPAAYRRIRSWMEAHPDRAVTPSELVRELGFITREEVIRRILDGADWAGEDAPKEDFIELNTPWAFRYGAVYGLYRSLEARGRALGPSDYTLGLWLADGRRAWYAPGDPRGRLKITTAHDRDLFEGYLLLQRAKEGREP